jgi:hypothetical protein
MEEFNEIPKVVFEVKDVDGNVAYRDSITYATMAELRSDSKAEREAKFQERYQAYLVSRTTTTGEAPSEEG